MLVARGVQVSTSDVDEAVTLKSIEQDLASIKDGTLSTTMLGERAVVAARPTPAQNPGHGVFRGDRAPLGAQEVIGSGQTQYLF